MDKSSVLAKLDEFRLLVKEGKLAECERGILEVLGEVRGSGLHVEVMMIGALTGLYGRVGRVFESLILSRVLVRIGRERNSKYVEARGLTGLCVGRYGLYMGADIGAEFEQLSSALEEIPASKKTPSFQMECAYVEFAHRMTQGDMDAAARAIDRFEALCSESENEDKLAQFVLHVTRALIALHRSTPKVALEHIENIRRNEYAEPYQEPQLAVVTVQAHVDAGNLPLARDAVDAAILALETAPPESMSDCIYYGTTLAELLESALHDVARARRVYDLVATAVVRRIQQLDVCMATLPELDAHEFEPDLFMYRREFIKKRKRLMKRVGDLFRDNFDTIKHLIHVKDGDDLYIVACAWCESVRDENGRWIGVGHYLPREGDFEFSHGICPTCVERTS